MFNNIKLIKKQITNNNFKTNINSSSINTIYTNNSINFNSIKFFNCVSIYSYTIYNNTVVFLRKNQNFLKSKFSKIRIFNKSIVLFSLLLNIIFVVELHSLYYNITLNYGYFIFYIYAIITFISIKLLFILNCRNMYINIKLYLK